MKVPLPRGSEINMTRSSQWKELFSGYKHQVTEARIDRWLDQFSAKHRDIAARILDCVDFVTYEQMATAFRQMLEGLAGWNQDTTRLRGKWRFVSFSASAGESGDEMLHKFRVANGLGQKKYNELFIHKSELVMQKLSQEDTVVFIDDFAGTGKQACEAWSDNIAELLPEKPTAYLVLVVASATARHKIGNETELVPVPYRELSAGDNVFSSRCRHFSGSERENLLRYCRRADAHNPKGFGDCGFVIVFAHGCPNNTIPIFHAKHTGWEGLFPR